MYSPMSELLPLNQARALHSLQSIAQLVAGRSVSKLCFEEISKKMPIHLTSKASILKENMDRKENSSRTRMHFRQWRNMSSFPFTLLCQG